MACSLNKADLADRKRPLKTFKDRMAQDGDTEVIDLVSSDEETEAPNLNGSLHGTTAEPAAARSHIPPTSKAAYDDSDDDRLYATDEENEDGIPYRVVNALSDEKRQHLRTISRKNRVLTEKIDQLYQELMESDGDTRHKEADIRKYEIKSEHLMDTMLRISGQASEDADGETEGRSPEDEPFRFQGSGHEKLDHVLTTIIQACLDEEGRLDSSFSTGARKRKAGSFSLKDTKDFTQDKVSAIIDALAQQESDGKRDAPLRHTITQRAVSSAVVYEAMHEAIRKYRSRRFNHHVIPIFSAHGERDPALPADPELERRFRHRRDERLLDDAVREFAVEFDEMSRKRPTVVDEAEDEESDQEVELNEDGDRLSVSMLDDVEEGTSDQEVEEVAFGGKSKDRLSLPMVDFGEEGTSDQEATTDGDDVVIVEDADDDVAVLDEVRMSLSPLLFGDEADFDFAADK